MKIGEYKHTCSVENGGKCGKLAFPLIRIVETYVIPLLSSDNSNIFKLLSHLRFYYFFQENRPLNWVFIVFPSC